MKKKNFLWALLLVPIALFGLYKLNYPTHSWYEKMVLTIETPDGDRSGHAVRHVEVVREPSLLPQMSGADISLKGEAIVLRVSEDKYLFALLGAPVGWLRSVYESKFPDRKKGNQQIGRWESSLDGLGPLPVPRQAYPLLVTFDDINDPASVREVDPNDLDATFGCSKEARKAAGLTGTQKCYSLKSITLEITDEPVTEGEVEKVLGWWCEYRGKYLVQRYGVQVSNDFARNIGSSFFRIGDCTK